jgi:hypothetical protein
VDESVEWVEWVKWVGWVELVELVESVEWVGVCQITLVFAGQSLDPNVEILWWVAE